jgi:hypothetical protein
MMVRAQWRRQRGNMGVGKREDQRHSTWQSGGVVLNVRRRHERASLEKSPDEPEGDWGWKRNYMVTLICI